MPKGKVGGSEKGSRKGMATERAKRRRDLVVKAHDGDEEARKALDGELTTSSELSLQRERFIHEYLVDGNGTAAAIRSGTPEASARSQAWQWMRVPEVREAIANLRETDAKLASLQRSRILAEQLRIATSNIIDLFDPATGRPLSPHELPPEVGACVEAVEFTYEDGENEDGVPVRVCKVKYKMHSKSRALDALFKYLGMYEADNRQTGESLGEALTGEARLTDVARRLAFVLHRAAQAKNRQA